MAVHDKSGEAYASVFFGCAFAVTSPHCPGAQLCARCTSRFERPLLQLSVTGATASAHALEHHSRGSHLGMVRVPCTNIRTEEWNQDASPIFKLVVKLEYNRVLRVDVNRSKSTSPSPWVHAAHCMEH